MPQRQRADAVGVRSITVSRWETGWNPLPPLAVTALRLLAEREGVSPSTSARLTRRVSHRRAG